MDREILLALLNWPFLLFVLLGLSVILFRRQLLGILSRGDITFSWGEGRSIRLRDLSEGVDKELDPIRDEIEALKEAVERLAGGSPAVESSVAPQREQSVQQHEDALPRMKEGLWSRQYRWRTLKRLAVIGGVSEEQAVDILRADPEIVFGTGKSGSRIAKLKSR